MAFPSLAEYERLVYGLQDALPQVTGTTLRLYSASALTAILEGSVYLDNGLELRVVEAIRRPADGITFDSPNLPTLIDHCLALADG